LGQLRPAGQKRGRGLLAPPFSLFHFFRIVFPNIISKLILTHLKFFLGLAAKTKIVTNKKFYNFGSSRNSKFQLEFEMQLKSISQFLELQKFHKIFLNLPKTYSNLFWSLQEILKQAYTSYHI